MLDDATTQRGICNPHSLVSFVEVCKTFRQKRRIWCRRHEYKISYVIVAETASSDQPFNCCLHLLDTLSGAIKALLCIYFNGAIDPFDSFPICSHECWVVKRPSKKFVLLSVKAAVCSTKLQTSSLPQGGSAAGTVVLIGVNCNCDAEHRNTLLIDAWDWLSCFPNTFPWRLVVVSYIESSGSVSAIRALQMIFASNSLVFG